MTAFELLRLILILFWVKGFPALEWTSQSQSHTLFKTCVGLNITFPWFFIVDEGESIIDIKWFFVPTGSNSSVSIATYGVGTFFSHHPRISYLGNGSLELDEATLGDTGNYTVDVSAHKGGVFSEISLMIEVEVAMPPSSSKAELDVIQTDEAVRDNATGQLHVQLQCGHLSSRGYPPVDVVWTTPSGSEEASSYFRDGNFYLLLRNPVKGGNYSCRLPPQSAATLCLASDDPLLRETTVLVDTVLARLTLVEAREEVSEARLDKYYAKSSEHVSFHAVLTSSVQLTNGQHVKFNDVKYNDGGAYNATTGEFTAPLNGSYFFAFTASPYGGNSYLARAFLMVDGNTFAEVYSRYNDHYNAATAHTTVQLVKGQKVWVQSSSTRYFYAGLSFFSGFLFHPDW